MTYSKRQHLRKAIGKIQAAERLFNEGLNALLKAKTDIGRALETSPLDAPEDAGICGPAATDHLREHKKGYPAKVDTDPELRAFILARLDRMTFEQLAAAVAANFAPERQISKSSIHRWWLKLSKNGGHAKAQNGS